MQKSYGQKCPVARALDLIGERWTLLILRDLFRNPTRRFNDFKMCGLSPSVVSDRLKSLEDAGLIASRQYSEHPPRHEYFLTAKGETLRPVMKALHEWGNAQA